MDLLTTIANEVDIPMVRKNQKIWFFRTKGGKFYYDFVTNKFIALGWNLISSELITDGRKTKEAKKAEIEKLYPEEKRPGLIFGQMDVFYNRMQNGDLVLIPDEGTKSVAIGIIGDFTGDVLRKPDNEEHAQCAFVHRRTVEWKKQIDVWQDIYLFRVLRAQQTISDITDEAKLVFRNLFPVYIAGDAIHITFQKETNANLSLSDNVDLLVNLMQITDATAGLYGKDSFRNDLTMKTAVGSPGFLEIIMPNIPVATISAGILMCIIRAFIGKEKTAEGATTTGLLALITKINELINDHKNRKKIDAEIHQIEANAKLAEAQAEKTIAEVSLIQSQTARENAEARRLEMENEQIALLPSGKTTEEMRTEGELLAIPSADVTSEIVQKMEQYGCGICKAAKANGLSFGGEKVSKVEKVG